MQELGNGERPGVKQTRKRSRERMRLADRDLAFGTRTTEGLLPLFFMTRQLRKRTLLLAHLIFQPLPRCHRLSLGA